MNLFWKDVCRWFEQNSVDWCWWKTKKKDGRGKLGTNLGRFQTYELYRQRHPEIKKNEKEFDLKGGQPRLENTRHEKWQRQKIQRATEREAGRCCREVRVERGIGQEIEERQRKEKRQRKREMKEQRQKRETRGGGSDRREVKGTDERWEAAETRGSKQRQET